jgi:hypothetical protein
VYRRRILDEALDELFPHLAAIAENRRSAKQWREITIGL